MDESLEQYLKECLYTPTDLAEVRVHLARTPGDISFWNQKLSEAVAAANVAEADYRCVEGVVFTEMKELLLIKRNKATESDVKALQRADKRYTAAKVKVGDGDADVVRLRGVCEALKAKMSALITLSTFIRAEMSDPTLNRL